MRTFGDQIKQLQDSLVIESMTERLYRLTKAAVRSCYADIATRHRWKFLIRRQQMNVLAPYSTGTVQYTASTRTLTLSGGTFPAWSESAVVLLNRNVYAVQTKVDGTHLVLKSTRCPVEDVAAGTAYVLAQISYDLPTDYVELLGITELERLWIVNYLPPEDLLARTQIWFAPSNIVYYTILGGPNGTTQMQWAPPPSQARTFDLMYQAKPRPFTLSAPFSTGTVSTTSGSTTVTVTDTLPQNIEGCVFRIGTATTPPDGVNGDNPAVEEHVIKSRVSATTFTIETPAINTGTNLLFEIDDPIDIEPGPVLTLFDAMCETRTLQRHQSEPNRIGIASRMESDAYVAAITADAKLIPKVLAGTPSTQGLADFLWGVTVQGP